MAPSTASWLAAATSDETRLAPCIAPATTSLMAGAVMCAICPVPSTTPMTASRTKPTVSPPMSAAARAAPSTAPRARWPVPLPTQRARRAAELAAARTASPPTRWRKAACSERVSRNLAGCQVRWVAGLGHGSLSGFTDWPAALALSRTRGQDPWGRCPGPHWENWVQEGRPAPGPKGVGQPRGGPGPSRQGELATRPAGERLVIGRAGPAPWIPLAPRPAPPGWSR